MNPDALGKFLLNLGLNGKSCGTGQEKELLDERMDLEFIAASFMIN